MGLRVAWCRLRQRVWASNGERRAACGHAQVSALKALCSMIRYVARPSLAAAL